MYWVVSEAFQSKGLSQMQSLGYVNPASRLPLALAASSSNLKLALMSTNNRFFAKLGGGTDKLRECHKSQHNLLHLDSSLPACIQAAKADAHHQPKQEVIPMQYTLTIFKWGHRSPLRPARTAP